ncbi:MAG: TIGR01212 family radical SAM protein [Bacteroidales bacterium]|nr:TIGR01212 family radical SAM protein [Bacteroidales bacterium]MBN2818818.1 TIGR01212 family radical SAM protein [Bacteroidales bacterium]
MSYSWGTERRFNAASNYFRDYFGARVQKVTIDAGFTCPNRDGTKSTGGCSFCNNDAFNPSYCNPEKSVTQQINEGISFHEKRYKSAGSYLAYFQAYSNTYATAHHLEKLYNEALSIPGITGLIIGTRPDCINDDILQLLIQIAETKFLVIEFGIESVYNETLQRINRGHSFEDSTEAIKRCNEAGLKCGGHLIFGLPGESREMMLQSVDNISELGLHTIKFHQLQIIKGTKMASEYQDNPQSFNLFTIDAYIEFIVKYIERLNPEIVIERLAGETQPWNNQGVIWNLRYDQVLQLIEKKMKEEDTWQGKFYKP